MKLLVSVLLLLASSSAFAQTSGQGSATLTWTPANTYTNGQPMTLASQAIYTSTVLGACETSPVKPNASPSCQLVASVGPGISSYVVGGLFNGTHYFVAESTDDVGNTSFSSNEVNKSINIAGNLPPGVRPNPPANLQVE